MARLGEIAVLLKTQSRGGTNIIYYSAKNGQYLCLKRKKLQNMGAETAANVIIIKCIGRNTG